MRHIKLAFWVIFGALLGVVFWQNKVFFLKKNAIQINLLGHYQTPELQIAVYLLVFFLAGLLISYFSSLTDRFVAKRTIRSLNDDLITLKQKYLDAKASASVPTEEKAGRVSDPLVENTSATESGSSSV